MGYTGFSRILLAVSEWIMKFSLTNILWLLFNLPIVYFVLTLLYADSFEKLQLIVITLAILTPFFFFPATTAMFGVVRDWILEKKSMTLIASYWKYYKENYVRSLLGGLIIVPIWSAWLYNFLTSGVKMGSVSFYFYVAITIFLFTITVHFFSDTVHFQVKLKDSLVKSILLAIGNPHYTIGIALLSGMLVFMLIKYIPVLIPFCIGSIIAYLSFYGYYRIFLKMKSLVEKLEGSVENTVQNSEESTEK
ncbi:YesL family protein [Lederbergia wuyishanensis]|uniref:Membrane protein YesL n=1 Tax=Lederbergia wuyishanensis TaxID=1347903 RepID=A0ABU0D9G3_9BACI|nr:DUF624 domain-containing protein [Lederbergia wuyishanensis]MCJ8009361.1 DUF624 domain-containing protein [Lederbergia wuyishanensis]MDQ0345030.1 putative membrane protein YesL [Lederbergia wuyishanensis]